MKRNWHLTVQFSSVTQSCPTLCDPMNCSTPGLPVHHQLPEFTQTHIHRVSDAIQPSHPLSSPSPPTPNPSQHQGLFQWVNSSHGRKFVTNLDSILKSRHSLSTKVCLVKAMISPVVLMHVTVGLWRRLSTEELMLLNCGVGEDSWESLGLQGDQTNQS